MSHSKRSITDPRVDCHQHFWQLARGGYGWLKPEMVAIYRDFLPLDLEPELKTSGINQTILVQADDNLEETRFLLSLAEQNDFVAGVVGWIDMEKPDAPDTLRELALYPKFKGIRPMLQDIANLEWVLQPILAPAFASLIEHDLSFDALVLPQHLDILSELMARYPELRVVIDHAAKPDIASGEIDRWSASMQVLASETSAYCKLSGLVTQAGDQPTVEYLQPFVDALLTHFGPDRLMWGSDWPVLNIVMAYHDWVTMFELLLCNLAPQDVEQIMGNTARGFYRLPHMVK